MYLFFDTETAGLPKDWKVPFSIVDNWPRVIQFAWALYNADGHCYKKYKQLIKPDGWEVPSIKMFLDQGLQLPEAIVKSSFWIDNNLSQSDCEQHGQPIAKALLHFINAMQDCKVLIAHNMNFDFNVIAAEMTRIKMFSPNKPIKFCTMMNTINIVKAPYPNGKKGNKFPSLKELHYHLFGIDFDGAHDAGFDVAATAKCFFELKRLKLINP